MPAAVTHRPLFVAGAFAAFAGVTASLILVEVPGLGLGHFYYLPIALMALSSNLLMGALAGTMATSLYALAVVVNPLIPSKDVLTLSTGIRGITFIATGALVGWVAQGKRDLLVQLTAAAERDFLTGLLNVRAFETELVERCAGGRRFTLLLGDMDGLKAVNDRDGHAAGNQLLSRFGAALRETVRADEEVARVGGDEFAVLSGPLSVDEAVAFARRLEADLDAQGLAASFGWAVYPADGGTSTALYRRADERLYTSKRTRHARGELIPLVREIG
jgi:diguanylate cyclase (GGDEF)-like protein